MKSGGFATYKPPAGGSVYSEMVFQGFAGLNNKYSNVEIGDNEASDLLNVNFDAKGAIVKRNGYQSVPTNLSMNTDFQTINNTETVFHSTLETGEVWKSQSGSATYRANPTTNLVLNSDFETVAGTAQVFSDPMTSGTAWTTKSGLVSHGSGGTTFGANGTYITAGNSAWSPIQGSGGQSLSLTAQITFTQPTTVKTCYVRLDGGSNTYTEATLTSTQFQINQQTKTKIRTQLASVNYTPTASSSYTMVITQSDTNSVSAKLYSGTDTTGTLLASLTAAGFTGNFITGAGGDSGIVVSNAMVTAPWADGWTIGGDSRVAWGLTRSAIGGNYSACVVGVGNGVQGTASQTITVSNSTVYTFSAYANSTNVGASGAVVEFEFGTSYPQTSIITGTTSTQRYSSSATTTSTTSTMYLMMNDSGTVTFDSVQLEQNSVATPYVRNDSTAGSYTAPAGALMGANGSLIYGGNPVWAPISGTGGQKLALTAQTTFSQPTFLANATLQLYKDANNQYIVQMSPTAFTLSKVVSGSTTQLQTVSYTPSTVTTYTMNVSLDTTGAITASLYSGSSATGTPLQTLNATDTSLTGGFYVAVGGDNQVIVSDTKVTAPWADGWTITGDSRVAWGLTPNATTGKYSANAVGAASGVVGSITQTVPITSGIVYTFSSYLNTSNVGQNGVYLEVDWGSSQATSTVISGTNSNQRYSLTATPTNVQTVTTKLNVDDGGTVSFNSVQLNQGSIAQVYIENDSPTSSFGFTGISSIFPYYKVDGTKKIIIATGTSLYNYDPVAYTQTLITSNLNGNGLRFSAAIDAPHDKIYFVNGNSSDGLMSWDGTNFSTKIVGAPNGKYLLYYKNHMYMAGDPNAPWRLYMSDQGDPTSWPALNYIDFPDGEGGITGLAQLGDSIVVFKERGVFILKGSDPSNYQVVTTFSGNKGAISHWSIVRIPNGLVYLARDGVYLFDGRKFELLSDKIQGSINNWNQQQLQNAVAFEYGQKYWLSVPDGTGQLLNNNTYLFHYIYGWWTKYNFGMQSACVFNGTTVSPYFIDSAGNVMLGDYGNNDNGAAIDAYLITKNFDFGTPAHLKSFKQVFVFALAQPGNYNLYLTFLEDFGQNSKTISMPLSYQNPDQWGVMKWGQIWAALGQIARMSTSVPGQARYLQFKVEGADKDAPFTFLGWVVRYKVKRRMA